MFYIAKVSYDKTLENGAIAKVKEPFLVNALTPTECEAIVTEELSNISSDFDVLDTQRQSIAEVLPANGEYFWLIKVAFITLDERTAKDKRSISKFIVSADSFKEAQAAFDEHMRSTLADWEYESISRTKIVDYLTPQN